MSLVSFTLLQMYFCKDKKKKKKKNITFIQQVHIKLININNVTKASGHNL